MVAITTSVEGSNTVKDTVDGNVVSLWPPDKEECVSGKMYCATRVYNVAEGGHSVSEEECKGVSNRCL